MKHTELPRDEEAIRQERESYWTWPRKGESRRYDMRGMRRKYTSISEDQEDFGGQDGDQREDN